MPTNLVFSTFYLYYTRMVKTALCGLKFAGILLAAVVCTGCLEINTEISIREDYSGTLRSQYTVSRAMAQFSDVQTGNTPSVLPIEREYITDILYSIPGAELIDYQSDVTEDDLIITTEIEFSDKQSLESLMLNSGMEIQWIDGSENGFDLLVFPQDEFQLEDNPFVQDLADSISAQITVIAPQPITADDSQADLVINQNRAEFEPVFAETILSETPTWIRIRW